MTTTQTAPCLGKLDAACFKHNPQWARRAFAYRLLHTLFPGYITRRLPRGLRLALIGSLVDVPPGLEIPGGVVVPPGTTIPPDYQPGDPPPDGWIPAPPPPPDTGAVAPNYNDTFVPGPTPPPGGGPAPDAGIPGSGKYESGIEADDGTWGTTTYFSAVSTNILVGWGASTGYTTLFARFVDVDIPQGAEITSAVLTLRAFEQPAISCFLAGIRANAADDAVAPISYPQSQALLWTTEEVAWTPGTWVEDVYYDSPDISAVIQEVVDRAGWTPGNALMIGLADCGISEGFNNAHSIDIDRPVDNPYLTVEWLA